MTPNEPTAVLREEHERIIQVVAVLEAILDRGDPLDVDAIERCVRFFRLFADACHHGKEEDLLFPELEARGLPRQSGPLAVMLHEHRLGRAFVAEMADAVEGARIDEGAGRRLTEAGRSYIALIRNHILKENHVLFDMADQMVDAAACQRLCAGYDTVCESTFEGCSKAQLEALADEIVAAEKP